MIYVYLIESVHSRQQHYVGITQDPKQRLIDHNEGKSPHTSKFKPWNLVMYLGFADEPTARAFEKFSKAARERPFSRNAFCATRNRLLYWS